MRTFWQAVIHEWSDEASSKRSAKVAEGVSILR